MRLLDGIYLVYFTLVVIVVMIMFYRNTQAQTIILKTYKEVTDLIANFRQEMHRAIKSAIEAHVAEYHK